MNQRGVIQELDGNMAKIVIGGGEGCKSCASKDSCVSITGTSPEEKIITVENVLNASVGDLVDLELPVFVTMKIITITFVLPVLLLIVGYWIMMPAGTTQGAIGAVGGLVVGMFVSLVANRALGKKAAYRMQMTKLVTKQCD